ncbi:glycosyltransferase [uncultured Bdellovibrio sp.]|uniref:glycosyltransferase n=1 Tax=Bdellovibrio sp. HCB-162 TaxID=3394234 RepID=UPI0025F6C877|nr:glycosyltransferase [uncultured Bdellovibrio sp.]
MKILCADSDLLVFSHVSWNSEFQRPQHLMTRYARYRRVFFVEPLSYENHEDPFLDLHVLEERLCIVTPHLAKSLSKEQNHEIMTVLLLGLINSASIENYSCWYYDPQALAFSDRLTPDFIVYDCVKPLVDSEGKSSFTGEMEKNLLKKADLVVNGNPVPPEGNGLRKAREFILDPEDQKHIDFPRLGFVGIIDERVDLSFLKEVALLKPQWQFVLIGPIVQISAADLPVENNIHYLGAKKYNELAPYLSNWDCAILPLRKTELAQYTSPMRIPEYLAAGLPIVSMAFFNTLEPYKKNHLIEVAHTPDEFVHKVESLLPFKNNVEHRQKIDHFFEEMSWEETWKSMAQLEIDLLANKALTQQLASQKTNNNNRSIFKS